MQHEFLESSSHSNVAVEILHSLPSTTFQLLNKQTQSLYLFKLIHPFYASLSCLLPSYVLLSFFYSRSKLKATRFCINFFQPYFEFHL